MNTDVKTQVSDEEMRPMVDGTALHEITRIGTTQSGERARTSTWIGKAKAIDSLCGISFPRSLGLLYSAFTYYYDFKVNSAENLLMELAPYGDPKYIKKRKRT